MWHLGGFSKIRSHMYVNMLYGEVTYQLSSLEMWTLWLLISAWSENMTDTLECYPVPVGPISNRGDHMILCYHLDHTLQINKQTKKNKQTNKHTDKHTDRQMVRQTNIQMDGQTDKHTHRRTVRQTNRQTHRSRQIDKQTHRTDKHTDKHTDRQTYIDVLLVDKMFLFLLSH